MSSGCKFTICFTKQAMPFRVLSTCQGCFSPNTATSSLSLDTSIPTYFSLLVVICFSSPYNESMPALLPPSGVRSPTIIQLFGLLSDGHGDRAARRSLRTYPSSICHVHPHDTTRPPTKYAGAGVVGVCAFSG